MRKRIGWILMGACAMATVAVATSSGASPTAGPRDAAWGGGHFQWYFGELALDRDFSVNVELGRFGDASGQYVYGRNGVSGGTYAPTCVAVSGNHAVIGWANQAGDDFLVYLVDNGTPASGTRDQITPLLQLEPAEIAQMPAGFPNVCPSPDTPVGGYPYSDVTGGDIVVRDVP